MNKILWLIIIVLLLGIAYSSLVKKNVALAPEDGAYIELADEVVVVNDKFLETVAPAVVSEPVVSKPVVQEEKSVPKLSIYDADGNRIVHYTSNGFIPQTIEIKPGDAINFTNDDILPLWVKAQAHPTAEYYEYAALNQGRSVSTGQSYIFTFTEVGTWGYINLNKKSDVGVIIVAN